MDRGIYCDTTVTFIVKKMYICKDNIRNEKRKKGIIVTKRLTWDLEINLSVRKGLSTNETNGIK